MRKMRPPILGLCLLGFTLAACSGGEDDSPTSSSQCALSCRAQSTTRADVPSVSLSCGTQPVSCQNTSFDQFSRITSMTCSYANGRGVTCSSITYNDLGQMTGGRCSGEGQTCGLP